MEYVLYKVNIIYIIYIVYILYIYIYIYIYIYVGTNPGPRKASVIKFCHWNLNGLAAHDFLKIFLIEAFITSHNFDIICLSETFLDFTVSEHDENKMINGYSLLRADHPSNNNRGGVCLYFKEHLLLIRRNDLSILQGCLMTETIVDNEKRFFTCLYRSLNQNHEELENFSSNLDLLP